MSEVLENTEQIKSAIQDREIIQIHGMHKWFGDFHVLKNINLTVKSQERIVICGPSGSGKSTLIRCINRLEEHQKGEIIVDNIELTNDLKYIPFNNIAILIEAICESENDPLVKPKTNDLISSFVKIFLSLFFLIIS